MIGEDLSLVRDEKSRAKNIEVYFRTSTVDAEERVVMLVSHRFARAGNADVVQFQSRRTITEANHNMNEANAGLVGLDNRLSDFAFSLEPLQPTLYGAQLNLQRGGVFALANRNALSQVLALLLKLKLLGITCRRRILLHFLHTPTQMVHHRLLGQHARL